MATPEVQRAAAVLRGVVASEPQERVRWRRLAALLTGWRAAFSGLPVEETWLPLVPRLRSVLVRPGFSKPHHNPPSSSSSSSSSSSDGTLGTESQPGAIPESGEGQPPQPQTPQAPSSSSGPSSSSSSSSEVALRLAAAELMREIVIISAAERGMSGMGGGARQEEDEETIERRRQTVRRLLTRGATGGGVLEIVLALMQQTEEPEAIVICAAEALGHIARAICADEQLKREYLSPPSTLHKAVKQLVKRLLSAARRLAHNAALHKLLRATMESMHSLGSTVRPQCATVEEACLALLESPHASVRKAAVEGLSVRLWCVGAEEWPTIVGQLMATIHQVLDPILPEDVQHTSSLRKSLPPAFKLRALGSYDRGQALVRRLSTLFRALHHCMVAPSPNHETRAVPVPIEHILDLIRRVLAPSPANFETMDKAALILWTCLPAMQFNAYQLLSSLVVCVGRNLMPYSAMVRRIIMHGLERLAVNQVQQKAWRSTLCALLKSISLSVPILAPILWKDDAAKILSYALPLVAQPLDAPDRSGTIPVSALKAIGAVMQHAGPLLSVPHVMDVQQAMLTATQTNRSLGLEFVEEVRRVLMDCATLPQAAYLLPVTFRSLQHELQGRTGATMAASHHRAEATCEILMHPRVFPRIRLAPPPLPVDFERIPSLSSSSSSSSSISSSSQAITTATERMPSATPAPVAAQARVAPSSTSSSGKRSRAEDDGDEGGGTSVPSTPLPQWPSTASSVPTTLAASSPSASGPSREHDLDSRLPTASAARAEVGAASSAVAPLSLEPRPAPQPLVAINPPLPAASGATIQQDDEDSIVDIVADGPDTSDDDEDVDDAMDEDHDDLEPEESEDEEASA